MANLKNTFYEDKEMRDVMKKYYQIKRNLLIQHNFIKFLEDYNRYIAEVLSVYLTFNGLSNDISHVVVA